MDIKLKNIKYLIVTKICAFILLWVCFMSACGSGAFLLKNEDVVNSKTYYDTYKFGLKFAQLSHNAVQCFVKLKNEKAIKASNKDHYAASYEIERFHYIKNKISNTVNFLYYIKNVKTGKIITNIKGQNAFDFIKTQSAFTNLDISWSNYSYANQSNYLDTTCGQDRNGIVAMLNQEPSYRAYAAVKQPLKGGDAFYTGFKAYTKAKMISKYVIVLLIISIILMLISAIYLLLVSGRSEKNGEIKLLFIDKIYMDVHTLLVIIAAMISLKRGLGIGSYTGTFFVLGIDVFIGISYILSMIRQVKNKTIIKNSLLYRIFKISKILFKLCFRTKVFKAWTAIILLVYGAINSILFYIIARKFASENGILLVLFIFLLIGFNIFAVYALIKSLFSLTKIMDSVKQISNGNLEYSFNDSDISAAFSDFADDIKGIQAGLKKAVDQAIKGERMKTELITNVSHDLKTPLTSIVNYVDLLKKEDLNNEKATNYINILEEKSSRLKQLIEDLVEASKASSGNLPVNAEKIDLNELVMQALGEYQERLKNAQLDVHIKNVDEKVLIFADGKHMWRIVENVITNVIKYSMPKSRIYVEIEQNDNYGVLTIKNISAVPLDISPEQLTERFVRGDVSRNTEGSGLGLSIAQSLANLQHGDFKIEIDGDLFKVIVRVPLCANLQ